MLSMPLYMFHNVAFMGRARRTRYRLDEFGQERNHEREQTSSFSEGETQNSVLEHLVLQARVAGKAEDESAKNNTDTSTGT